MFFSFDVVVWVFLSLILLIGILNCVFWPWFVCQAIKILDDEMQCDIIKIGNLVRKKVSVFYSTYFSTDWFYVLFLLRQFD